jgi:hypothetical protein
LRRCPGCRKIKEGVWDVEEIVKGGRDPTSYTYKYKNVEGK